MSTFGAATGRGGFAHEFVHAKGRPHACYYA